MRRLRVRGAFPSATPLLFSPSFSSSSSSCPSCCGRPTVRLPLDDPPRPKKVPFTASAHGQTWQDPYHWMSDTRDPDLLDHLRRENLYADAFMADTEGLRRRLASEMRGRIPAKVSTPPERWGPWVYYQYIPEGKEYPVLCRRWDKYDGFSKAFSAYLKIFKNEEILLDWNQLAENFGYVHVGTCRVSPNHRFLAYTVDNSGGELFNLQIKDLQTGQIVNKSEVNGVVSLAWAITNDRLFYTICDDTQRPCSVHCTKIGSNAEDVLLFTEKDTSCCLDITSTKDGKFITINSNTRASSEVHVIDSANEHNELWLVQKRVTGVQYFLEHHHGFFYILTNSPEYAIHDSGGYHLARCCANRKSQFANWQDIIIPDQDVIIQDMDIFDGHLVLFLQRRNFPALCSIKMPIDVDFNVSMRPLQLDELKPWFFPLPSDLCSFIPASNHDFQTSNYRVVISSPVMPDLIVDYNMSKKDFTFVHQEEVLGLPKAHKKATDSHFYDGSMGSHCSKHQRSTDCIRSWDDFSNRFYCERVDVVSHDGTKVPLTILYSHEAWHPGRCPGLLHGYGSYGEALDKSWCANHISLLDRGWVLAFADVRGGGGIEPSWHEAGSGLHKLNSVLDFIACGKYLVKKGYVLKDKLCAIGSSAGGLLVGATMNMCPDLFSAAILKVPFLDMCNTMLDPTLPLTTLDYEEFGDPRIEIEFEKIRSYSPYDNIPVGVCQPPMLILASFNDSRYIRRNQLEAGFPLFETESLKWPGFVEFDDVNGKVLTYSAQDGIYKVFDLKNYAFLYSISDKNVQEIKISPGIMLLIFHRAPGYVPLKILSIEDGTVLKTFNHLLHRNKKIDFIEQFNEKLLVKQENENLQILDVRNSELTEVSRTEFMTPSAFIFLYENHLFLTFRNRTVAVWNFKGELVTSFEDHLLWHPDCNTNNIYITSDQDLIISYCKAEEGCEDEGEGSAVGSINMSNILTGKCIAKICSNDPGLQIGPRSRNAVGRTYIRSTVREALEDVTALFYDEDRNEIYTGNKQGLIHVWSN